MELARLNWISKYKIESSKVNRISKNELVSGKKSSQQMQNQVSKSRLKQELQNRVGKSKSIQQIQNRVSNHKSNQQIGNRVSKYKDAPSAIHSSVTKRRQSQNGTKLEQSKMPKRRQNEVYMGRFLGIDFHWSQTPVKLWCCTSPCAPKNIDSQGQLCVRHIFIDINDFTQTCTIVYDVNNYIYLYI